MFGVATAATGLFEKITAMESLFEMNTVLDRLTEYGIIFLFVLVFLEYLNLPGLPAGVIMPAAGIVVSRGEFPFWLVISVSLAAGLLGSIILYWVGFFVGSRFLNFLRRKFKSTRKSVDKVHEYSDRFNNKTMFVTRLIPVIRTIIPLVEGTARRDFYAFLLYSSLGIFIWNSLTIAAGFFFEQWFL